MPSLRAILHSTHFSIGRPLAAAGLVCSSLRWHLAKQTKTPKLDYSSSSSNNLQNYNNYLPRHNVKSTSSMHSQPVCHYAAPLLGRIKTNITCIVPFCTR